MHVISVCDRDIERRFLLNISKYLMQSNQSDVHDWRGGPTRPCNPEVLKTWFADSWYYCDLKLVISQTLRVSMYMGKRTRLWGYLEGLGLGILGSPPVPLLKK